MRKPVAIVINGAGNIGKDVAEMLNANDWNVERWDRSEIEDYDHIACRQIDVQWRSEIEEAAAELADIKIDAVILCTEKALPDRILVSNGSDWEREIDRGPKAMIMVTQLLHDNLRAAPDMDGATILHLGPSHHNGLTHTVNEACAALIGDLAGELSPRGITLSQITYSAGQSKAVVELVAFLLSQKERQLPFNGESLFAGGAHV